MPSTFLMYDPLDPVGNVTEVKTTGGDRQVPNSQPAGLSWLKVGNDHPAIGAMLDWRIVGGQGQLKDLVTISVTKPQIVADGLDEFLVTFSGILSSMKIIINRRDELVVEAVDPQITITSDIPMTFVFEVGEMDSHRFVPVMVEAV
ncbi:hypothetical protein LCGC14_2653470 [marine sediment metagenome]|uniref:Uncharacterized protein n=1 Tax=marine sediment metagenome TaxID=412755 RepID=A0A0F9CL83_9ZZZZ